MKLYQQIPIQECGEPLVPIPADRFMIVSPHPYQILGAPYGDQSPYYLRQSVLERLVAAQITLQQQCPSWQIQIFDAYRPIAVQQFMVDSTFCDLVQGQGLTVDTLTPQQKHTFYEEVYQFWAPPSSDPATPPPHSTGAAVDVTLIDQSGQVVDMGSAIDEVSARSYPHHFANHPDAIAQQYHSHRQLLAEVMLQSGFQRHPNEWWHFSFGDQMWAWLCSQAHAPTSFMARYGRV
jgi:D-alanyl-D-alanine dipeptidase